IAAFVGAALLLHSHLNHTIQQQHGIYAGVSPGMAALILQTFVVGLYAMLGCLAFFDLLAGADPRDRLRANLARPLVPALASILFIALWFAARLPIIQFLTPVLGSLDRTFGVQKALLVAMPAMLWL